jgi:hypothetical protein
VIGDLDLVLLVFVAFALVGLATVMGWISEKWGPYWKGAVTRVRSTRRYRRWRWRQQGWDPDSMEAAAREGERLKREYIERFGDGSSD